MGVLLFPLGHYIFNIPLHLNTLVGCCFLLCCLSQDFQSLALCDLWFGLRHNVMGVERFLDDCVSAGDHPTQAHEA